MLASLAGLQFLPRLEPYGLAGRNRDFFTGARIAPDATLAGLNDKDAKAAQLDTVAARQRFLHRMKQSIHSLLSFQFRHAGPFGDAVNNVELDHDPAPSLWQSPHAGDSWFSRSFLLMCEG